MRNRIVYFISIVVIILLGLLSRKFPVPSFIGDIFYAIMIYFVVRFVFTRMKIPYCAIIAVLVCFTIEISQLYQQPWANELRSTWIGRHVFGSGFLWSDLVAYTFGALLALAFDKALLFKNRVQSSTEPNP